MHASGEVKKKLWLVNACFVDYKIKNNGTEFCLFSTKWQSTDKLNILDSC